MRFHCTCKSKHAKLRDTEKACWLCVELSFSAHVLDQVASSVEQVDPDTVMVLSKRAVDAGIDPAGVVENGILRQASRAMTK